MIIVSLSISLIFNKSIYDYEITDFRHVSSNRYNDISVGLLTNSDVFLDRKDKQKVLKDKIWKHIKGEFSRIVFPVYLSLNEAKDTINALIVKNNSQTTNKKSPTFVGLVYIFFSPVFFY